MDLDRAIIRLSLFCSVGWLAFWGWRYVQGCIHVKGDAFFCPNASGQSLERTDVLHMILYVLVPPLLGLGLSWWIWRQQRPQTLR
jgi:hypothetical protein